MKSVQNNTINSDYAEFSSLVSALRLKNSLPDKNLKTILQQKEIFIPVSVLNTGLSCFEAIVKFLRENLEIRNKDIAVLTGRNERSISTTYHVASMKSNGKFIGTSYQYYFPLSILKDRTKGVLESICYYLHNDASLSINEISELLGKNYRTVWTSIKRFETKNER